MRILLNVIFVINSFLRNSILVYVYVFTTMKNTLKCNIGNLATHSLFTIMKNFAFILSRGQSFWDILYSLLSFLIRSTPFSCLVGTLACLSLPHPCCFFFVARDFCCLDYVLGSCLEPFYWSCLRSMLLTWVVSMFVWLYMGHIFSPM